MSNRTLHTRIVQALEGYRAGDLSVVELESAVGLHGRALEAMPQSVVKALSDIDYELTMARLAEEDGRVWNIESTILKLEVWLGTVPLEAVGS